jgi:hypothetical protein
MPDNSDVSERETRIRNRAERLWRDAGEPAGEDERFWHEAELQINIENGAARPRPPPIQRDDPAGPPVGTPPRR